MAVLSCPWRLAFYTVFPEGVLAASFSNMDLRLHYRGQFKSLPREFMGFFWWLTFQVVLRPIEKTSVCLVSFQSCLLFAAVYGRLACPWLFAVAYGRLAGHRLLLTP